ncbi:MAG: 30S ribosomal protein S14 [Alphaproteobacteria bacterium]|nr:MAG: 30S ribosomal protein S14 [Alphaproteobacteria bacterium]
MAKFSSILKNSRRKDLIERKRAKRAALKATIYNKETSFEDRLKAVMTLAKEPRNSSATRYRNRCSLSGRPRAYYRDFGVSRIALRDLASFGEIPGVRKASW